MDTNSLTSRLPTATSKGKKRSPNPKRDRHRRKGLPPEDFEEDSAAAAAAPGPATAQTAQRRTTTITVTRKRTSTKASTTAAPATTSSSLTTVTITGSHSPPTLTTVPLPSPKSTNPAPKPKKWIIIGSVLGGIVFLSAILITIWCCLKRRRSRSRHRKRKKKSRPKPNDKTTQDLKKKDRERKKRLNKPPNEITKSRIFKPQKPSSTAFPHPTAVQPNDTNTPDGNEEELYGIEYKHRACDARGSVELASPPRVARRVRKGIARADDRAGSKRLEQRGIKERETRQNQRDRQERVKPVGRVLARTDGADGADGAVGGRPRWMAQEQRSRARAEKAKQQKHSLLPPGRRSRPFIENLQHILGPGGQVSPFVAEFGFPSSPYDHDSQPEQPPSPAAASESSEYSTVVPPPSSPSPSRLAIPPALSTVPQSQTGSITSPREPARGTKGRSTEEENHMRDGGASLPLPLFERRRGPGRKMTGLLTEEESAKAAAEFAVAGGMDGFI